jgi:sarcosine oxidase, subunit gamma
MSEAVTITRTEGRGMITLRADLSDARLAAIINAETGLTLPEVRRIVASGETAAAWMAPDELMLFQPAAGVAARVAALEAALAETHHLVADVSDARALFRLEGAGAREVLAKGAPVDLAASAFGPGDFRRTRLGQVAVAFWMPAPDIFELMCFRSVADHVALWLDLAARPGTLPGVLEGARPA